MVWLPRRAFISAEHQVHEGRNVGVVARLALAGMMPMMKFRRAYEHTQRADGQTHIGMNVDGPKTPKSQQTRDGFEGKPEDERRQVDQAHGINGIQRVLAMGCQPIQMFGAVMNRVETPEEANPMLQPMAPIDKKV